MNDIISDIPPELKLLGIRELIELLKKVGGKLKESVQERIKELIKSKKYFISISDQEVLELYKITKCDLYKRLESCLISHWSLNLIALGIYISKLNELDQTNLTKKVINEVHKRYKAEGLRILEMGSTGVIDYIIEYLSNLKMKKNYNFKEMGSIFDKIIERWKEISIFVKAEDDIDKIENNCLTYLNKMEPLFFIFAYGSAVKNTINSIAKMNNEGKLSGYIWEAKTKRVGSKEVYSCTFESTEGYGIDIFA